MIKITAKGNEVDIQAFGVKTQHEFLVEATAVAHSILSSVARHHGEAEARYVAEVMKKSLEDEELLGESIQLGIKAEEVQ